VRYGLLVYENSEPWNDLSHGDDATPQRAEEIAARWPDAQHWGMEIRALRHGGANEG
jgi:hypothetical protein